MLGFGLVLGIGLASPRQIFERLPGLAVGGLLLALPLAFVPLRLLQAVLMAIGVVAAGWWMAGGPLQAEDLRRAAPVWLAVSLLAAGLVVEAQARWLGFLAAALLAGLLAVAATPGPWLLLALCGAAASGGALAAGPALGPAARLPLAMVTAGVAAGPVLARGAPSDWAVALGPAALVVLGPRLGAPWASAVIAAAALGIAFALGDLR